MHDDELGRLLREIPREAPPSIAAEAILEETASGQRRMLALALLGLAALGSLAVDRTPEPQKAPVHLDLRVVEGRSPTASVAPVPDQPEEFDRP